MFDILEQAALHLLPLQKPPLLQLKGRDLWGPPPLVKFLDWLPTPQHLRSIILPRSAAAAPLDKTFAFKSVSQAANHDQPPPPLEIEARSFTHWADAVCGCQHASQQRQHSGYHASRAKKPTRMQKCSVTTACKVLNALDLAQTGDRSVMYISLQLSVPVGQSVSLMQGVCAPAHWCTLPL